MTGSDETQFSMRLDDQICFDLYAASRAVTAWYRPMLDRLGLTYPQYLVLLVLWDQGACAVKDLAAALHLDYGTLSPLLKRLESAGLLSRERRADDERCVEVSLTAAGTALRDQAQFVPCVITEALGLTPKELDRLRVTLRRLTTSVRTSQPSRNGVHSALGRRRRLGRRSV